MAVRSILDGRQRFGNGECGHGASTGVPVMMEDVEQAPFIAALRVVHASPFPFVAGG